MSSPSRQARQVQGTSKPAVLSAIPPHVWDKPRRRRRKLRGPRASYIKPGPSPLRRSFTLEDLRRDAARAAREPRYSNPFDNQPCQYHYLFPPGSPYESWNPKLSTDFWPRVHQYFGKDRSSKNHYLFLPGSPYDSWSPEIGVHSRNTTPNSVNAGRRAERAVVESPVAKNKSHTPRSAFNIATGVNYAF